MGWVTQFFVRPHRSTLVRPPQGCCTYDTKGRILTSTLPSSFPREMVQLIGNDVLAAFKAAASAGTPLQELTVSYPTLTIRASLRRSSAAVFLIPRHETYSSSPPVLATGAIPDDFAP